MEGFCIILSDSDLIWQFSLQSAALTIMPEGHLAVVDGTLRMIEGQGSFLDLALILLGKTLVLGQSFPMVTVVRTLFLSSSSQKARRHYQENASLFRRFAVGLVYHNDLACLQYIFAMGPRYTNGCLLMLYLTAIFGYT